MTLGLARTKQTERAGALGNYSPELTSPSTQSLNQRSRAFEVAKVSIRPGVLWRGRIASGTSAFFQEARHVGSGGSTSGSPTPFRGWRSDLVSPGYVYLQGDVMVPKSTVRAG